MAEKFLHVELKEWYAQPGDGIEVPLEGFIIDIVRGDLLVEIQTQNFSAIKDKLIALLPHHPVRLVYPIAREKWIVKLAKEGEGRLSLRKSPKRGTVAEVFDELVSFPQLLSDPNFSLEVLFIQEEEVRRYDGRRGWRRKGWVTEDRHLLGVLERRQFGSPADIRPLVPEGLRAPFSTADLATAISRSRRFARKMAYCLREMGLIEAVDKRGNAILYQVSPC